MSNQNHYRNMIDEIHVSSELLEKLVNMNMDKRFLKKKKGLKRFVSIAAVCVIVFLASNGISYAATGSTWISKIITYYGNDKVLEEIEWSIDEDGQLIGESEYGSHALGGFFCKRII